jgi:hypothetical protein
LNIFRADLTGEILRKIREQNRGEGAVPAMVGSGRQVASTTAAIAGTAARPIVKQLQNMKLRRRITQHI